MRKKTEQISKDVRKQKTALLYLFIDRKIVKETVSEKGEGKDGRFFCTQHRLISANIKCEKTTDKTKSGFRRPFDVVKADNNHESKT